MSIPREVIHFCISGVLGSSWFGAMNCTSGVDCIDIELFTSPTSPPVIKGIRAGVYICVVELKSELEEELYGVRLW